MKTSDEIAARIEQVEALPDRGVEERKIAKEQTLATLAIAYQLAILNENFAYPFSVNKPDELDTETRES